MMPLLSSATPDENRSWTMSACHTPFKKENSRHMLDIRPKIQIDKRKCDVFRLQKSEAGNETHSTGDTSAAMKH